MTRPVEWTVVALLFGVLLALSACTTPSVQKPFEGPVPLDEMRANPSAIRSLRECRGRFKEAWCPK